MQLHEAGEVIEVQTAHTANQKLAEGRILLAVVATGPGGDTLPWYVLGKRKKATVGSAGLRI